MIRHEQLLDPECLVEISMHVFLEREDKGKKNTRGWWQKEFSGSAVNFHLITVSG